MSRKGIGSLFGRGNCEYTRLGEVQNVKSSNVYVFGDDDLAEEDVVEFEMSSVRSRKDRRNQLTEKDDETPEYVERRLTEDDTLQSVALQYQCPVSEIKRVNNLIRDQDFYALTSVKIPVKKHSFLIDKIQNDEKSITESQSTLRVRTSSLSNGAACIDSGDDHSLHYDSDPTDLSDPETQRSVIRKISIRGTKGQSREARQFLREMDKDLSNIMKNSAPDRNSLDEVISVLTHKSVNPLITPDLPKHQEYCSVKWKTAIVILLCVAVVVPVAYIIYYVYVSHDFKRHNNG